MADRTEPTSLLLPERTRLLHIGPMKTGTTSLQSAARDRRAELLEHGVRYPGTKLNHRREVGALMGRGVALKEKKGPVARSRAGADSDGIPPAGEWDELMREIDADQSRRALVSHELIGDASDEEAARFVESLGERTHVVITLRATAEILPSLWIQGLKSANTQTFSEWLERAYERDGAKPMSARFQRARDQAGIVDRWAKLVGRENVTVIMADKTNPDLLVNAFESMLGLPHGFLVAGTRGGYVSNRSMTADESELVRKVNDVLVSEGVNWGTYIKVVRNGLVKRVLGNRDPAGEPKVALPAWAADLAVADGKSYAQRIADSGVRVVGDLASLYATPRVAATESEADRIPMDLSVDAVVGAVKAAHKTAKPKKAPKQATANAAQPTQPKSTTRNRASRRIVKGALRRARRFGRNAEKR